MVRVSNFGNLAVVALENPGAYDQEEFDVLVHDSDLARISECLDEGDYTSFQKRRFGSPTTAAYTPGCSYQASRAGGSGTSTTYRRPLRHAQQSQLGGGTPFAPPHFRPSRQ